MYQGGADAIFEQAWVGDKIPGNDYGKITDLCFTKVSLEHDY